MSERTFKIVICDPIKDIADVKVVTHNKSKLLGENVVAIVDGILCEKDCDWCYKLLNRVRSRTIQLNVVELNDLVDEDLPF